MIHHPQNHLERLRIKKKKDEQKAHVKSKEGRLWRAIKERDKQKEEEDELREVVYIA